MRIALPLEVAGNALRRCDPSLPVAALAGTALGTSWRVRYVAGPAAATAGQLRTAIETRLSAIVAEMSQWNRHSVLSHFNRAAAGTWFTLPRDFAAVLDAASDVATRCYGSFDPTHGRAAALLGFGALQVSRPPSSIELDAAFAAAGWDKLEFDPASRRIRQPGGLWLDLSGIAKGFAVDAIGDVLADHDAADALVEIGGELSGRGLRPDGQPWWVDLESPPGVDVAPLRIGLHEQAVATSGNYIRGPHTLDPRNGRPLATTIVSASVVGARCMTADAWATAMTVLGTREGMAVAARENLAIRLVASDGTEAISPALQRLID